MVFTWCSHGVHMVFTPSRPMLGYIRHYLAPLRVSSFTTSKTTGTKLNSSYKLLGCTRHSLAPWPVSSCTTSHAAVPCRVCPGHEHLCVHPVRTVFELLWGQDYTMCASACRYRSQQDPCCSTILVAARSLLQQDHCRSLLRATLLRALSVFCRTRRQRGILWCPGNGRACSADCL